MPGYQDAVGIGLTLPVAKLGWNANTEPDLAGYKLFIGRASGTYDVLGSPVDVGNVTAYTYTITASGTWFFSLIAYNTAGLLSGFSNEVSGLF